MKKHQQPTPTHYEVLGIAPDAAPPEIAQAYREQASALHPDRLPPGSPEWQEANERLKAANAAYAVLKDPAARAAYDARHRSGAAAPPPPSASASAEAMNPRAAAWPYRNGIPDEYRQKARERRRRQRARQEAAVRAGVGALVGALLFVAGLFACYQIETLWYRQQAFALQQKGADPARATRLLHAVIARRPQDGEAHYRLGLLLDGAGQTRSAVVEYEAAIASSTRNIGIRYTLADALARAGQTSAAIDTYRQYLQLARSLPSEQSRVATAEMRLVDLERQQQESDRVQAVDVE